MTTTIPRACVMGYPVAHSRSPMIHGYWLDELGIRGAYDLQELTPEAFPAFLTHLGEHGYVGGNITVPHKQTAFRLVDARDAAAEAIGAVNTVWREGGTLFGGNSDAHGFIANLDACAPGWDVPGGRAVILGAGGAARAAAYALVARGLTVVLVNRTEAHEVGLAAAFAGGVVAGGGFESLARLLPSADLLVNCTSLGMVGKPRLPIDLAPLKHEAVVYDIVYVPLETELLAAARRQGNRTADGLGMLLHQAGFGFGKWFGAHPRITPALRAMVEADIVAKTAR
ncbi:MAG: shikimate dehydrogenase [Casimicrobiaceae bacterium]